MQHFRVRNWEKFQHYHTGNRAKGIPQWIKLHTELLDNYGFYCLQDASKGLLVSLWIVAARVRNRIPLDFKWLKTKTGCEVNKKKIQDLVDARFIEIEGGDASKMLADGYQGASTNRIEENRIEKNRIEKKIFGEFEKVKLTEPEYQKLVAKFGKSKAQDLINRLDQYIASKGEKYKSHYATILSWERKDNGPENSANAHRGRNKEGSGQAVRVGKEPAVTRDIRPAME